MPCSGKIGDMQGQIDDYEGMIRSCPRASATS